MKLFSKKSRYGICISCKSTYQWAATHCLKNILYRYHRKKINRYTYVTEGAIATIYIDTKTGPIPYTVASASSVTGSVFMRRFRLFSGQCNSGTMQSTSSWLHRLKRSGIDYRRQYLNRDAKDIFPHIHTYLGQCV